MITSRTAFSSYENFLAALKTADWIEFASPEINQADACYRSVEANELELDSLKLFNDAMLDQAMPHASRMDTIYEAFELHLKSVDIKSGVKQDETPICLEQRFAAFSDQSVLNAVNVISCVFLILVHHDSKFTLGAHIDGGTTSQHIVDAIKLFLKKIGDNNASLTCHLIGGDTTTLEMGTLVNIYHALKDFNVALGAQALTIDGLQDSFSKSNRPLNIAYDPPTGKFYPSRVSFSNKLRKIQATIFYILCHQNVAQSLELHVIASHRQSEFEYYPLRITKESLLAWMSSAVENEFEENFIISMIQHLNSVMVHELIDPQHAADVDEVLYDIAEAYKYAHGRLNNKSVFFQPRAVSQQPLSTIEPACSFEINL